MARAEFFFKYILEDISLFAGPVLPCFGLLVMSSLDFKHISQNLPLEHMFRNVKVVHRPC